MADFVRRNANGTDVDCLSLRVFDEAAAANPDNLEPKVRVGELFLERYQSGDATTIRASRDMIRKGITLHGVWHYNLSLYPELMKVIQGSPVIDALASHVFPMSRIQEAFEVSASHECAKILLKPWE